MALLNNLFGKKLKGENKYFDKRKSETSEVNSTVKEKCLVSDRMINKDLMTELLKTMKNHDVSSSIVVLANTIDNTVRKAGIMINKGYIPKKIVAYLKNISIAEIEEAIKIVKTEDPDQNGFYSIDEQTATRLNLPLGCMLLGILHHMKREFGLVLVLKENLKDRQEFVDKVKKIISR